MREAFRILPLIFAAFRQEGKFPVPVKLSDGGGNACIRFVESEVAEWQASRIAERDARRGASVRGSAQSQRA